MSAKLLPLKIPSGWAILYNSFGDEDPIIENNTISNNEFYKEDLLSIESMFFDGQNWLINQHGYILDLGWYPDSDPKGCYRLTLLKEDWDNIVVEYESQNRYEIAFIIEKCFDLILQGINDRDIEQEIRTIDLSTHIAKFFNDSHSKEYSVKK